ncbi:MAG: ABC transporter permease [Lachnospiraceae bacterium]|nr:ABC transporter permease [Lachnospiraceae bacterium]
MIRYIITKIINKYKLYLCLFVGVISMIMVCSMIMLFRGGSLDKLIQGGYISQCERTGKYPASIREESVIHTAQLQGIAEESEEEKDAGQPVETAVGMELVEKQIDAIEKNWKAKLSIPVVAAQRIVHCRSIKAEFSYRGNGYVGIGYIDDPGITDPSQMKEHYEIVEGGFLQEDISSLIKEVDPLPEDAIPCLVSQKLADERDLIPGEIISFYEVVNNYEDEISDEPVMQLYINGIVREKEGDYFWTIPLKDMENMAIIDKNDYQKVIDTFPKDAYIKLAECLDYRYIVRSNVSSVFSGIRRLKKNNRELKENLSAVLASYMQESRAVKQMLYVIVLPLALLVLVFIGMISFRIIDSESWEILTLLKRGLGKRRIFLLYVLQSVLLALLSVLPGVLSGYFVGRLMARADDFMSFSFELGITSYRINMEMLWAGLAGAGVAVLVMLLPVLFFFRKKKNGRVEIKSTFWEKYFLDVILLCFSLYLLYNYRKQMAELSARVLAGNGIDPVIFIDSTAFLLACGMLMLRLIFFVAKLIFRLYERRFSPPVYAGMLQILRSRGSSSVISIFLVMMMAMSCFNANMARTINSNKEERLRYENGADVRLHEFWFLHINPETGKWHYTEPDPRAYEVLAADGTMPEYTKVIVDDQTYVTVGRKIPFEVTIMGIHPKQFGQVARLRDGLLDKHWYNYLNELSATREGVIISENLAQDMELTVGDTIKIQKLAPKPVGTDELYAEDFFVIKGIVDVWPGFNQYSYGLDDEGNTEMKENYLVVVNEMQMTSSFGSIPYEIWIRTDKSAEMIKQKVDEAFAGSKRYLKKVSSWEEDLIKEKSTPIMQITNGIFTADFLIALFLCMIGYLIYWLTSIRDRELMFGVYRAMGITKKEINRMLAIEQSFLSITSIMAGILAGELASWLFAPVFAAVYLPKQHNVPVFISAVGGDLLRILIVLLLVVSVCVVILRRIVGGMNITEALKLGDD